MTMRRASEEGENASTVNARKAAARQGSLRFDRYIHKCRDAISAFPIRDS